MSFDKHSLEAYSTIASVTGTNPDLTITVQTGDGAKFGNPQNVTIWPSGVQPTLANSTIGRISAISTDTLTVTTAQEGSSNITVSAGMQIANTITPKVLTDIESGGLLTTTALSATAGITSGQLAASGLNLPPATYNPYKLMSIGMPHIRLRQVLIQILFRLIQKYLILLIISQLQLESLLHR
jgi:hypothetical protein